MKRRDFLAASAVLSLLAATPASATKKSAAKKTPAKPSSKSSSKAGAKKGTTKSPKAVEEKANELRDVVSLPEEPAPQWQTYDITSTVQLREISGPARLWLPLVQYKDTLWERSLGHSWKGNFQTAGIYRDPVAEMEVFYADWPEGTEQPQLQIVSQVATQDRHFDITRHGAIAEHTEVLRRCLHATSLVPTDGIVRSTAERAAGRVKDPLALGKAIYDWVVENVEYVDRGSTGRAPDGVNVGSMLESGRLAGDSTDISLLFVALCRSIGIPARPVFGLRLDSSRLFASLGLQGDISNAQHCRAEFYIPGYSWIPVDPADVGKATRDEQLSRYDPKLTVLKKLLFGFWEMNWVGFNAAQDVALRGSSGASLPVLIQPVLETGSGRFDDPHDQRYDYRITATRAQT